MAKARQARLRQKPMRRRQEWQHFNWFVFKKVSPKKNRIAKHCGKGLRQKTFRLLDLRPWGAGGSYFLPPQADLILWQEAFQSFSFSGTSATDCYSPGAKSLFFIFFLQWLMFSYLEEDEWFFVSCAAFLLCSCRVLFCVVHRSLTWTLSSQATGLFHGQIETDKISGRAGWRKFQKSYYRNRWCTVWWVLLCWDMIPWGVAQRGMLYIVCCGVEWCGRAVGRGEMQGVVRCSVVRCVVVTCGVMQLGWVHCGQVRRGCIKYYTWICFSWTVYFWWLYSGELYI